MASPTSSLFFAAALAALLPLSGCMSAADHRAAVHDTAGDRLTVGVVQKDLRTGMSGADVIALLGSPNIVTTDEQRREVWTYDKVSAEVVHSGSSASLSPFLAGSGGSLVGAGSGQLAQSAGAVSRTERTLTVVVKFDENRHVRDFAYRATQF